MHATVNRSPGKELTTGGILVKPTQRVYTLVMLLHAIAILLSIFSQPDASNSGLVPYVFHIKGSNEKVHVIGELTKLEQSYGMVRVQLNEPWLPPGQRNFSIRFDRIEERYPEPPAQMRQRIRDTWLERGGVEVETLDGPVWIQGDEYELAQRSVALAKRTQGAEIVDGVDMAVTSGSGDVNAPGFFALWGMHIGIAVATLVLGGGVVWVTMLRTRWSAL